MSNIQARLISTNQSVDGAGQLQTAGAAFSLAIAAPGIKVTVLDFSGYCNGTAATNYYLMFFAQTNVPANGTQPIFKQQILGADGFKFSYMPKGIQSAEFMALSQAVQSPNIGGLIAVLSTTPETLTIGTGGNTMDLDVFIEEGETLPTGATIVGDLTTGVKSLQVWSEAAGVGTGNNTGAKNLLKVWAINKGATTAYLQLFAQDAPVTNAANPALAAVAYIPQASNPVVGGAPVQAISVNAELVPIQEWTVPSQVATSGTLVPGQVYTITTFAAGDNFTNVGANANATGAQFVATGTTPTTWSNGSTLTATPTVLNLGDADAGIVPLSIDPGTTNIRRGCSLFASTTAGYLTAIGSSNWVIRAEYK